MILDIHFLKIVIIAILQLLQLYDIHNVSFLSPKVYFDYWNKKLTWHQSRCLPSSSGSCRQMAALAASGREWCEWRARSNAGSSAPIHPAKWSRAGGWTGAGFEKPGIERLNCRVRQRLQVTIQPTRQAIQRYRVASARMCSSVFAALLCVSTWWPATPSRWSRSRLPILPDCVEISK